VEGGLRRIVWGLGAVALVLAMPSLALATPQDIFGFGARSPGMAFTGVSFADDYEAAFLNPAGFSRARHRALYLGMSGGTYHLSLDGERFPVDASRGMTIGFTLPVPFGDVLQDRIVLGGGFFTPSSVLLAGQVSFVDTPQFNVLDRAQAAAIQVGVGFDFHGWIDGLRAGVAVSVAADVIGDLFVRLDETNSFSSVVETQLVTAFAPMFGASWDNGELGFGLVYRTELKGVMNLAVTADDLPIEIPPFQVGGLVHYDPATLAAEVFYMPTPELRLVLQGNARFWNDYPGPQIKVTDTSGTPPDIGYSFTLSPRVAAEWLAHDGPIETTVRGGYAYEPSPAGPARMVPALDPMGMPTGEMTALRYLDNDRHVLTLGVGFAHDFGDGVRLRSDVFAQLHVLAPRTHEIGATDGAAPMETSGTLLSGGWTFGLEL
jgi:long-chain fatty acid transport protein